MQGDHKIKSTQKLWVLGLTTFAVFFFSLTLALPSAVAAPCQSQYLKVIEQYNGKCRAFSSCWAWRMGKIAAYPSVQMRKVGGEMANWWNFMVGHSWARLGPRKFELLVK